MSDPFMKDKVAFISGGTGGVGLLAAELLLRGGATVIVNGRSEESGHKAIERLAPAGKADFQRGDAASGADMKAAVEACVQRHGRLDIVISAGAQGSPGPTPFADMTTDQLMESINTRLYPRLFPVHAALPALKASGGGSVVMLTTDAARHPTPGEVMVGAAGAAVVLATKGLAKELSRDMIRVNSVAMTITSGTPSWDRIFASESFQSRLFEKAVSRFPSGRPPTAEEVARVAVFLASDAAAQITGQTVSVNGGLSFGGW